MLVVGRRHVARPVFGRRETREVEAETSNHPPSKNCFVPAGKPVGYSGFLIPTNNCVASLEEIETLSLSWTIQWCATYAMTTRLMLRLPCATDFQIPEGKGLSPRDRHSRILVGRFNVSAYWHARAGPVCTAPSRTPSAVCRLPSAVRARKARTGSTFNMARTLFKLSQPVTLSDKIEVQRYKDIVSPIMERPKNTPSTATQHSQTSKATIEANQRLHHTEPTPSSDIERASLSASASSNFQVVSTHSTHLNIQPSE